ncbi:hypothetical protein JCM8208_005431 [Rhodotorula glutinis]
MSQGSAVATAPPVAAPTPVAPSPLSVDPRRLSLNPATPAPRPQESADNLDKQPVASTSTHTSPEPAPRPDRSPLFRPSSALAHREPPSASTSAAPSPARPTPTPSATRRASLFDDDDEFDELDDDGGDDLALVKAPVASTSKAPAAPPTPLGPPVKRYAGNLTPSALPPKKRQRTSTVGSVDRALAYRPPPLPHYTVVRAAHVSYTSPHVIRIHDDVTDGSSARWPADSERDPKHTVGGRENWYECPGPDEGRHLTFREKLGEEMAKKLGLSDDDPSAPWVIEALPKGHLFTVHHSVTSSNHARQDTYIFGSAATHKFRTVNEFVPHLYWLLSHGPGDGLRCECKYCTKKSQSDVNRIVGLTDGRSSSVMSDRSATPVRRTAASTSASSASRMGRSVGGSVAGGHGGYGSSSAPAPAAKAVVAKAGDPGTDMLLPPLKKKKKKRMLDGSLVGLSSGSSSALAAAKKPHHGVDAVAAAAVAPQSTRAPAYRGPFVMRQRDEDLRDVGVPRQGEVVWAKLARPLEPRDDDCPAITHWPAIVRAREFVSEARVVREEPSSSEEDDDYEDEDELDELDLDGSAEGEGEDEREEKEKGKEAKRRRKEARAKRRADKAIKKQDGAVELAAASNLEPKAPIRLSTTQRPVFTLALLGLADELRRVELADTLPWLAHTPPGKLMKHEFILHPDSAKHVWDGTRTMRDASVADFTCAEDAATAIALACQVVAHVVPSFTPGEKYAITSAAIEHKSGTPADQIAAVEEEAAMTWAFQCVYFGAELIWPGDVVRLLNPNLVDLLGPKGAVKPGEDRVFFLRVAILFKAPESDSLKFGGEVWTLDEVVDDEEERAGSPKVNGNSAVDSSTAKQHSSTSITTNGNGSSTSPVVNGAAAAARASSPAALPRHMPPPPAGHTWRLLTEPGTQGHFDLDFVGSRVYPLPAASNSRERIRVVGESVAQFRIGEGGASASPGSREEDDADAALGLTDEHRALVLAGLRPTTQLYMRVGTWRPSRQDAIIDAEKQASDEVGTFFKARARSPLSVSNGTPSREGSAAA